MSKCSLIFCKNKCSKQNGNYCKFHSRLFEIYQTTNLNQIDKVRFQELLSFEGECVLWRGLVKDYKQLFHSYEHNGHISAKDYIGISAKKSKCSHPDCLNPQHYIRPIQNNDAMSD